MDSTGNNMKKKIINYLKYAFGFIFAWAIVSVISTLCYMVAFHGDEACYLYPQINNFINFLWGLSAFSGMWFVIFLLIDTFIVNKNNAKEI